jgi:hypothetical protein
MLRVLFRCRFDDLSCHCSKAVTKFLVITAVFGELSHRLSQVEAIVASSYPHFGGVGGFCGSHILSQVEAIVAVSGNVVVPASVCCTAILGSRRLSRQPLTDITNLVQRAIIA